MTTYRTNFCGDTYEISADWSQPSAQVSGPSGGRSVADFGGSPAEAMRDMLEQSVRDSGDDPDDFRAEIDAAVNAMAC